MAFPQSMFIIALFSRTDQVEAFFLVGTWGKSTNRVPNFPFHSVSIGIRRFFRPIILSLTLCLLPPCQPKQKRRCRPFRVPMWYQARSMDQQLSYVLNISLRGPFFPRSVSFYAGDHDPGLFCELHVRLRGRSCRGSDFCCAFKHSMLPVSRGRRHIEWSKSLPRVVGVCHSLVYLAVLNIVTLQANCSSFVCHEGRGFANYLAVLLHVDPVRDRRLLSFSFLASQM